MIRSNQNLQQFAEHVQRLGGTAYYVGGCVRDDILGRPTKDTDVEVLGVSQTQLETVLLRHFSDVDFVGKQYGVYKVGEYDISLPRMDHVTSQGIATTISTRLSLQEAAQRRDLTINALYVDVLTGELLDPTGRGLSDLKNKLIDCVDRSQFLDDPLRPFRAVRFKHLLDFEYASGFMSDMLFDFFLSDYLALVPSERIAGEYLTLATKATTDQWQRFLDGDSEFLIGHPYPYGFEGDDVASRLASQGASEEIRKHFPREIQTRIEALYHPEVAIVGAIRGNQRSLEQVDYLGIDVSEARRHYQNQSIQLQAEGYTGAELGQKLQHVVDTCTKELLDRRRQS